MAGELQDHSISQFCSHTGSLKGTHPNHSQWTLAFSLAALPQSHHLPSNKFAITIAHASRDGGGGGLLQCYSSLSPSSPLSLFFFSSSHFLALCPLSLSPSFRPLLCKPCNFSLQWENRYNRGRAPVCLIKGWRRGEER